MPESDPIGIGISRRPNFPDLQQHREAYSQQGELRVRFTIAQIAARLKKNQTAFLRKPEIFLSKTPPQLSANLTIPLLSVVVYQT